jgi:hypothetical protein
VLQGTFSERGELMTVKQLCDNLQRSCDTLASGLHLKLARTVHTYSYMYWSEYKIRYFVGVIHFMEKGYSKVWHLLITLGCHQKGVHLSKSQIALLDMGD